MKRPSPARSRARAPRAARLTCALCAACALIAALPSQPACAASVEWPGSRFVYRTNGSSVTDALHVFASGQHLPMRIDGPVEGVVSGRFFMPPQRFLDTLTKAYGLVWYYDGAVLQVSSAGAQVPVALRPHALTPQRLVTALEQAGVTDAKFPPVVDEAARTVDVFGPLAYVARMRAAAERFERDANARTRTTVRVLRVKNGAAADGTRVVDGRALVVPGEATILRRHFVLPAPAVGAHGAPQVVELGTPLPAIEADAVTNSILIRDKPERLDADAVLAADLDVAPQLVSVQTWVIDVDADALDSLQPVLEDARAQTAGAGVEPGLGVVPDGGRALLTQIGALVRAQRAQVEVSQTALTQDRAPAVIDRHEERLARRADDELPEDPALDLWLTVRPTVEDGPAASRIRLGVELGRSGDVQRFRRVEQSVAAGECLVIEAPRAAAADARARLVLLVPRVAA